MLNPAFGLNTNLVTELIFKMKTFTNNFRVTGLILLLLKISVVYGQAFESDTLLNRFNSFRKNHLQEKIFVHTDKDNYLTGEILWYKIYDVDASFHKPVGLSAVAYLELTDNNNKRVLIEKSGLKNGFGDGAIFLSQNIASGNYKLRVYTSWMKNSAPEFYFEKKITVINSQHPFDQTAGLIEHKPSIQVFPEGGNLITGLPGKVAVKVIDATGSGVKTTVTIKDENQNIINTTQTNQFGLASFTFTPLESHTYEASVNLPAAGTVTKKITEILSTGFVLNTTNQNEKLVISIRGTPGAIQYSPVVYLFVHCRQSIKKIERINTSGNNTKVEINRKSLGDGINHITLFDQAGHPVCERLVFNYPANTVPLTIERNQKFYEPREKILLTLSSPSISNLSLSVYKSDSLQERQESFIDDYLLLSSDLGESVSSPGWYFENVNDSVIAAMDDLMLTQGWRRFNWKQVMNNEKPIIEFLPELNGQLVNGKIINTIDGKPGAGITTFASIPSMQPFFKPTISDSLGRVHFLVNDVYGTPGIILQMAAEDSNYRVELEEPFSKNNNGSTFPSFEKPLTKSSTFLEQNIALQVRQNYTGKSLNKFYNPSADTLPFFRYANATYLLDQYTRFTTMEEIFREYVPYVAVRKHNGQFNLPMYNDAHDDFSFNIDPLILVDGVPVFNTNKLMAYDPLKVRKIDLVTTDYFIGPSAFSGIISLTTYNGNIDGFELDPKTMVIDYESLQLKREFYAPAYETLAQRNTHLPDFRYLLHWAPNISIDKTGKTATSFFSSDVKGKFIAIVQGISSEGLPCKAITEFEVK
jgi:hypothetical protein